jgi:hypothetical protein
VGWWSTRWPVPPSLPKPTNYLIYLMGSNCKISAADACHMKATWCRPRRTVKKIGIWEDWTNDYSIDNGDLSYSIDIFQLKRHLSFHSKISKKLPAPCSLSQGKARRLSICLFVSLLYSVIIKHIRCISRNPTMLLASAHFPGFFLCVLDYVYAL